RTGASRLHRAGSGFIRDRRKGCTLVRLFLLVVWTREGSLAGADGRKAFGRLAHGPDSARYRSASRKNAAGGGECLTIGKGLAAVDLLNAAVMDSRIASVAMQDSVLSYAAIARSPIHRQIFDAVIPGVLGKYDLPDLVAALAPRPVSLINLRSPAGAQV